MAINILPTKLVPLVENSSGELSDHVYRNCNFCGKEVEIFSDAQHACENLSTNFFCTFCLRHGFYTKNNRNILIMSFRSILGTYYYNLHLQESKNKMWLSEIHEYNEAHEKIGLLNPVFTYDSESFLWFVDFSRVGSTKKKIKVQEVFKTILNILVCFNLTDHIYGAKPAHLYKKYHDAVLNFYFKRSRPEKRRILIPTLNGCGIHLDVKTVAKTRNFVLQRLLT